METSKKHLIEQGRGLKINALFVGKKTTYTFRLADPADSFLGWLKSNSIFESSIPVISLTEKYITLKYFGLENSFTEKISLDRFEIL